MVNGLYLYSSSLVTAIFKWNFSISPRPLGRYSSFESLNLVRPSWKSQEPVKLVIIYDPSVSAFHR